MPTRPYPCTPEKFSQLRQDLADAGATILFTDPKNNAGTFNPPSHPEITVAFDWNGTDTITISIPRKEWWEPADAIFNGLAPYLA